ncbi:unnamed protein product [Adineta ricciae]|uniref:Uncharacterized protein n=1 Tax=Adineta ricciae TaxID=249248 RepID=A0A814E408_ADIRI|nr:unnamed protein product [Adineta ricciae]
MDIDNMMYGIFFVLTIFTYYCESFFKYSPLQLSTITRRQNLTCATDFGDTDVFTNCEYCVYEFFNNGTDSTISHDCIYITNSYRLVTQRCSGFTSDSDTGYGLCSPLPFEYFDIDLLCICATNLCNENLTMCKHSVDTNPRLPALPSPIPTLSANKSAISCQDTPLGVLNSTYYCVRDSTPYINMTQCEEYVRTHTVVCMYLEMDHGSYLTLVAIPDEDYEYVLADEIDKMQRMNTKTNVQQYYNETSAAFYIQWTEVLENADNYTMIYNRCYCMTNNCNVNLTECLRSHFQNDGIDANANHMLLVITSSLLITMNFQFFK